MFTEKDIQAVVDKTIERHAPAAKEWIKDKPHMNTFFRLLVMEGVVLCMEKLKKDLLSDPEEPCTKN